MTIDIERLLRRAAGEISASTVMAEDIFDAVARRRRRNARVAVGVTAATVAITAGAAVSLTSAFGHQSPRISVGGGGKHPSPTTRVTRSAHPTIPALPALPTPPPPTTGAPPRTFFGLVGAGGERLAVVDSATGVVQRYLQQTGSQELARFNADRTIAYQPSSITRSCGTTWAAINLKTGATTPAYTNLKNPDEVAQSADGGRIAYTSIGRQKTVEGPNGPFRGGCPTAARTLIIADQQTGQRISIPLGHYGQESVFPNFDTSGNLLAIKWQRKIQVLNLAAGGGLSTATVVPVKPGCDQVDPAFRARTDQLMIAADCRGDAELDGYSMQGDQWKQTYRRVVANQPHSFLASFGFDQAGQHLIYSVDVGNTSQQGAIFVQAGASNDMQQVANDIYEVAW
jgi:hypothetical protein